MWAFVIMSRDCDGELKAKIFESKGLEDCFFLHRLHSALA